VVALAGPVVAAVADVPELGQYHQEPPLTELIDTMPSSPGLVPVAVSWLRHMPAGG
jgi:hypothetical protein